MATYFCEQRALVTRFWLLTALLAFLPMLAASPRADVVFLMRASEGKASGYFDLAAQYYQRQPGVVAVVASARSMLQVREFLQRSPLRGTQPWGKIILVAHGSRWAGLQVAIFADEGIASPLRWSEVLANGEFIALTNGVVDATSLLQLESCGLGYRADLMQQIAVLLSGTSGMRVHAEKGSVEFRSNLVKGKPITRVTRTITRYLPILRKKISKQTTSWTDAQGRHIPISFRQELTESQMCVFSATRLAAQQEMLQTLTAYGLRVRDLLWNAKVKGKVCVLRGRAEIIQQTEASHSFFVPEQVISPTH